MGNIFPPIYLLYPDIKLFNFEDPDMTIHENSNKKNIKLFKPSSSDSNTSSSSDSESEYKSKQIVKNNKNNLIKTNKIKKIKPSSSFPTISTIKYDVFKDKKLNGRK